MDALEERPEEGVAEGEFYRCQAEHAFGNENNEDHDPGATELAWRRTLDSLGERLE